MKEPQLAIRRLAGVMAAAAGLIALIVMFEGASLSKAAREQLWTLNTLHLSEFEEKLGARPPTGWYVGVGPGELQPEADAPRIRPESGFFDGAVEAAVEGANDEVVVRCSFDGSAPTADQEIYAGSVTLHATTVMQCRSFQDRRQPSPATTRTFLVDPPGSLPVLSVVVEPSHLWNPYAGIYVHYNERGRQWERNAVIEWLPREGGSALAIEGKLRVHGNFTRSRPKKSLRFLYEPIESSEVAGARGNVLTLPSAGNERAVVLVAGKIDFARDELFRRIAEAVGVLTVRSMPVALYLNGEPWGVYFVRERIDDDYLQRNFGEGEYDLLVGEPGVPSVVVGDRGHWNRTIRLFESLDFSTPAALEEASQWVDIENLTDFWLLNIFAANFDWPHHNFYVFRDRSSADGRWRWISWDADAAFDLQGFGLEHDTLAWSTRSTLRHDLRFNNEAGLRDTEAMRAPALIIRKLLENPVYRARFVARFDELLATVLRPENLEQELDRLYQELAGDLEMDFARWSEAGSDVGRYEYLRDIERVRQFIRRRPAIVEEHFGTRFDEGGMR